MEPGRIHRIWLQPPLAFARVGTSESPLDAFRWTQPDLRPRGSGRTALAPRPSFTVDPGGVLREQNHPVTLFRDEDSERLVYRLRPVCPFFELHGDWEGRKDGDCTALTLGRLQNSGFSLLDLTWSIRHANLKAYVLTHSRGDRIEACETIPGNHHQQRRLWGCSPGDTTVPLVQPPGIDMGALQVVQPINADDRIRLRFYAPKGHAYGPRNLRERISRLPLLARVLARFHFGVDWKGFSLPDSQCILNPDAEWPNHKLITCGEFLRALPRILLHLRAVRTLFQPAQFSELLRFVLSKTGDAGKLPPGLFAWHWGGGALISSLGIIDDTGDGIVTCALGQLDPAYARVVVCPPHFAPDRRPPVSLSDNLMDRTARDNVRAHDWVNDPDTEAEIDDLLDRAFETAGLMNLDVWNQELAGENKSNAIYRNEPDRPPDVDALLWPDLEQSTVVDLPLTARARWHHRRNAADEFLEQLVRDDPTLLARWIRNPDDSQALYYDKRMPALMRGSDRRPLHLTRRQLEALRRWVEKKRSEIDAARSRLP